MKNLFWNFNTLESIDEAIEECNYKLSFRIDDLKEKRMWIKNLNHAIKRRKEIFLAEVKKIMWIIVVLYYIKNQEKLIKVRKIKRLIL